MSASPLRHVSSIALALAIGSLLVGCARSSAVAPAVPTSVVMDAGTVCLEATDFAAGIRRVEGPVGSTGKIEMLCGDEPIMGAGCTVTVGVGTGECTVPSPPDVEILESNEPLRCAVAPVDPPPYPARILVSGCSVTL